VGLSPTDFAARATSVSVAEARAALTKVGVELPPTVTKGSLSADLAKMTGMTQGQINEFLKHIKF
jgi:hypothetical protein